jgi:hypothetical protein
MPGPLSKLADLLTPKRRWAQFSLSTVFIVMTALCIMCARLANLAARQRDAVTAIKAIHGQVCYDVDYPGYTATFFKTYLRRWLARDYTDDVVAVSFLIGGNSNDALVHLRSFKRLRELYIDGEQVTDAGLRQLSGLTELQELDIGGPVRAFSSRVGYRELPFLVTDVGVAELQKALPNCRISVKR